MGGFSLHREQDGAGPWGGGPGLWGWGAAGRGKVSYCSVRPHCPSHTQARGGMQAGGSLQVPQSLPGQPLVAREGRMRHFCCCPCRGLAWRALRCKCDAATTPPKAPGAWGCLRGQAANRGYHGAAAAASRVPPTHSTQAAQTPVPGQHRPSCVRVGWRRCWRVLGPLAVADSGHGAGCGAVGSPWRRARCNPRRIPGSPGTGALLSSHVPSPSLLGSPGGGPGPARRGAAAVMLTCCPPAGDSPSPLSAPGSPAASPPSCGPHTSTCPAAHPAPGDTVGMGLVKDTQPGPHGPIPIGYLTTRSSHRGFTTPIPPQGFCKGPPAPKG